MALTEIEDGMLTDGILTASKLNTTGTASSTTVLKGDFSWGIGAAATGIWNVADSAPGSPVAGDMWYAGGVIYIAIATANTVGVWTTAAVISQTLVKVAATGTQAAGLKMGGMRGWDEGTQSSVTEEYNGSTWSASGSLNTARSSMTESGTQSAAMCAGGSNYGGSVGNYYMNNTEEYNGTAWSNVNNLATGTQDTQGDGTQSAAWCAGGYQSGPTNNATNTQIYNGTTWSNQSGVLNTGRQYVNGCGTTSAGLIVAGRHDYVNTTEEWDGTSWAYGANVNYHLWKSGVFGIQTAAVSATGQKGGSSGSGMISGTEEYDGTTWTNSSNVLLARMTVGAGSSSAGMTVGGEAATQVPGGGNSNLGTSSVEEWIKVGQFNPKGPGYS